MQPTEAKTGRVRRLFKGTVLVAIVGMAIHIGIVAHRDAGISGDLRVAGIEGNRLYDAFDRFHSRNGAFPPSVADSALDLKSFEPLLRRGYYDGGIQTVLRDRQADAYGTPPDLQGPGTAVDADAPGSEFWVEMTLERDPSIRLLVVRSDDAPISGGRWLDGVYLYRNGKLESLR